MKRVNPARFSTKKLVSHGTLRLRDNMTNVVDILTGRPIDKPAPGLWRVRLEVRDDLRDKCAALVRQFINEHANVRRIENARCIAGGPCALFGPHFYFRMWIDLPASLYSQFVPIVIREGFEPKLEQGS